MQDFRSIGDFIDDASFRDWVLKNDPKSGVFWRNWLLENPDKKEVLMGAKAVLLELDQSGNDWNSEKERVLYQKIHRRINQKPVYPTLAQNKTGYSFAFQYRAKAAIISFLLLVSVLGFLHMETSSEKESDISAMIQEKDQWNTKSNPKGQKSKIHLPDGSTVILNADSEIRYRTDFEKSDRDIFLKGESFFEVAKDSLLPFRVYSGELVTTAMGTSFNINSYDKERVKVQLATGKVKVSNENQESEPVFLHPGEEVIREGQGDLKKRNFDRQNAFLWKDGTLRFADTSYPEFKITLERWYGVEI
ncbi:MAG: FecR domain-containing protein, partial [Cyclobacteriaceae bacterium]